MEDKPVFTYLYVYSKHEERRGELRNGVSVTWYEKRQLTLSVYEHPFSNRTCFDCGKPIKKLDIYGEQLNTRPHCVHCMDIPAGVEAREVVFRMKRKTKAHPKGEMKFRKVQTPEILEAYFNEWGKIYEKISEKVIWTSKSQSIS